MPPLWSVLTQELGFGLGVLEAGAGLVYPGDMAKAKGAREKIRLESSAGTGFFYTTMKNRRNTTGKLELKKYDPVVRKHVVYKEKKLR